MALYNQNYQAILISAGINYTPALIGDGYTATTVHQIFCLSDGVINITALGGGSFQWSATTSESVDVLVGSCSAITGSFVGFKTKNNQTQQFPYYKY